MDGQQMDGLPSGMCLCPCAQGGQDTKQDPIKDGGGDYNKGSDNVYKGEYQDEADKYIKDKVSDSAFCKWPRS